MEELDTRELKYSMDLDSSSENDDNSSESSKFQEDFLDTQELSYSVDLSDLSESDQSESDESIPHLCLLKPYDFEPLVKKFKIICIFKLQRQQLNVLVIQICVNVGYVNQWNIIFVEHLQTTASVLKFSTQA